MASPSKAAVEDFGDDEDDYMNMVIPEPTQKESRLQRLEREKRERYELSHKPKTQRERDTAAAEATEAALQTPLDSSNRGFQMLSKLGYKKGGALGKSAEARTEPIRVSVKGGREGVGMESSKKRKLREAFEEEARKAKIAKQTEEEFFASVMQEQKNKRFEGQFAGAQKVAEKLDTEMEERETENVLGDNEGAPKKPKSASTRTSKPLKSIHVIWRGLVRHRLEKQSEALMRKALETSRSHLPTYEDADEDDDDKRGLGREEKAQVVVDEDLGEEDSELEEFNALQPQKRLEMAVQYLRDTHNYCFWCKYQYPDDKMDGCPGLTEDDHD